MMKKQPERVKDLADRAVEGAGTPSARVSAKAVADLIAHGGFDVLTRILASDRTIRASTRSTGGCILVRCGT